jgi:hypothetical protein
MLHSFKTFLIKEKIVQLFVGFYHFGGVHMSFLAPPALLATVKD